ncbi:putative metalloprotease [Saccharomycopsis crataegensis]|uniref:Mitochondrial inner membrane protease ATP23 n=1 Tax=Saccharomycopsis crataegensis TaxID=43959 RepID=A0AAV5QX87_9ASCO|nr:putative metalloprotease [Saccharomycopsis crataegensis]
MLDQIIIKFIPQVVSLKSHSDMSKNELPPPDQIPQAPSDLSSISGFEWWRRTLQYKTGLGLTPTDKTQYENDLAYKLNEANCQACNEYKNWIFNYSPTVRFLTSEITKVDPSKTISRDNVHCDFCPDWTRAGGYHPELGILVCQNRIINKFHMEDTLSHELVHAYDDAKFQVDWMNLRHHACSEIRASSLSGECRFWNQFKQGAIKNVSRGHQECVKRRAVLSVMANPNCKDKEMAEQVVNDVWGSCFNDTRPFERIYR